MISRFVEHAKDYRLVWDALGSGSILARHVAGANDIHTRRGVLRTHQTMHECQCWQTQYRVIRMDVQALAARSASGQDQH